jgi:hypothetical protein
MLHRRCRNAAALCLRVQVQSADDEVYKLVAAAVEAVDGPLPGAGGTGVETFGVVATTSTSTSAAIATATTTTATAANNFKERAVLRFTMAKLQISTGNLDAAAANLRRANAIARETPGARFRVSRRSSFMVVVLMWLLPYCCCCRRSPRLPGGLLCEWLCAWRTERARECECP